MATLDDYKGLITSEHNQLPKYMAMLTASLQPFVDAQAQLESMVAAYDLDTAVGAQLDAVGEWVGLNRVLRTPIADIYFTWDDVDDDGWDYGVWQSPGDPSDAIISLPDDTYRLLLKGQIVANHWNGSIPAAYEIVNVAFNGQLVLAIQDNQDMTMNVYVSSAEPMTTLTKAVLTQGYIPIRPVGVQVNYYFTTPSGGRLFAWSLDNTLFGGWGEGSWPIRTTP